MRKTLTNNIAERCREQGQQPNGNGSCLDNCESNGDPLLSVQLEKVLTIITPASPRAHLNQREDQFLSKSYDLTLITSWYPSKHLPAVVHVNHKDLSKHLHVVGGNVEQVLGGWVEGAEMRWDRQRREKSEAKASEIKVIVLCDVGTGRSGDWSLSLML